MTRDTPCLAEKQQSATLLLRSHGLTFAASETVERRVSKNQRELKLGDRLAEHVECDRHTTVHFGEDSAEQCAVGRNCVQSPQHFRSNRVVVARELEPSDLSTLGRWDEGLSDQ